MKIKISELRQGSYQTRTKMNGQPMTDLVESIGEVGLAVPIKVKPIQGGYEIVYGHRRVEAVKRLGLDEIESIVEELTDEQAMIQGLAENIQRDDLDPIDEANAYKRLQDEFGWSLRRIAKEVGKSNRHISGILALLNEPEEIQQMITKDDRTGMVDDSDHNVVITEWHVRNARQSGLEGQDKTDVLKKASSEGLTAAQTRRVADAVKEADTPEKKQDLIDHPYEHYYHDKDRVWEEKVEIQAHKPTYKSFPEVKWILDFIKAWTETVDRWDGATVKMSPEAMRFLAMKLRTFVDKINNYINELEKKGAVK